MQKGRDRDQGKGLSKSQKLNQVSKDSDLHVLMHAHTTSAWSPLHQTNRHENFHCAAQAIKVLAMWTIPADHTCRVVLMLANYRLVLQSLSKTLGVQKKGMKVQRGSRKPAAAKSESRREPKGGKARLGRNRPGRRAEASRPASRNVSKTSRVAPSGGRGSVPKRTVDLPKLTDLRITISNTQVLVLSNVKSAGLGRGTAFAST